MDANNEKSGSTDLKVAESIYRQARLFAFGGEGVACDKEKAISLYGQASELGHLEATCQLAEIYLYRDECHRKKAVRLLTLAAERGHAESAYELAECYSFGFGVGQDKVVAARLYRQAAEDGWLYAMLKLGICLLEGVGVQQDLDEAEKWLKEIASHAWPEARVYLARIRKMRAAKLLPGPASRR